MRNSFLERLRYDEGQGALLFEQVRYLIIRPETLIGFQKAVEGAMGQMAEGLIFRGGLEGGERSARRLKEQLHLGPREVVQTMCSMGTEIGWGRFSLVEFDQSVPRMLIEVSSSPFAGAYGASSRPVCHFTRGVIAGIGKVIFGQMEVIEQRCLATGADSCRFLAR
jgi:predicted hydrocarbon binding protein